MAKIGNLDKSRVSNKTIKEWYYIL
jgi:hypothetical protein